MASRPVSDAENVMESHEQACQATSMAKAPVMSAVEHMRPSILHKSPFSMVPPGLPLDVSQQHATQQYLTREPSVQLGTPRSGPTAGPGPGPGPPVPLPPGLAHLMPLQPSSPNLISPSGPILQPHVLPPSLADSALPLPHSITHSITHSIPPTHSITPSLPPSVPPSIPPSHRTPSHTYDVPAFVYDVGFVHAMWTDTTLTIGSHPKFHLHALFASRCRKLHENLVSKNRKKASGPPYKIQLDCADSSATSYGLSLVLGTLYGRPIDMAALNVSAAKSLVASASFLEMDDVAILGLTALLQMLSPDTAMEILDFALVSTSKPGEPLMFRDVSVTHPGPYPRVTAKLVRAILDWLASTLTPVSRKDLHPAYQAIITSLPFPLYKYLVEHPNLRVEGVMQRHFFAREATKSRDLACKANYPDFEPSHAESVVLTFGSEREGKVEVIRKSLSRRKSLWKVQGS